MRVGHLPRSPDASLRVPDQPSSMPASAPGPCTVGHGRRVDDGEPSACFCRAARAILRTPGRALASAPAVVVALVGSGGGQWTAEAVRGAAEAKRQSGGD